MGGFLAVAVMLIAPLWTNPSRVAADGEPAAGFGTNGVVIDSGLSGGLNVYLEDVIQLRDGSFVVGGHMQNSTGNQFQLFMVRYTANGQRDPSFPKLGVHGLEVLPSGMVTMLDGRIAVPAFGPGKGVAFLNPDGSTSAVVPGGRPSSLLLRPDGAVIAVGGHQFLYDNRLIDVVLPNGTIDRAFDSDVTALLPAGARVGGRFPTATFLSDGRLVVGFTYLLAGSNHNLCGVVAFAPDGRYDPTFGLNGLVTVDQDYCSVRHYVDDMIILTGSAGVLGFSPSGAALGQLGAPLNGVYFAIEGTGWLYEKGAPGEIVSIDPLGFVDPTFGIGGVATVPGITIDGAKLLDSGDIITWGNGAGNPTSLALGLIKASFGTALQPPALDTTKFVPLPPKRILDTRDGTGAPTGKVGVGGSIDLQITDVAGVPATNVTAVVLNVTATDATQAGYVTAYPSGWRRPLVSNVNVDTPGQTVANLVTTAIGDNGKVTLFSSGGAHLVADIAGYYTPVFTSTDGRLQTATPERILDTREGLNAPIGKLAAGQQIDLQVTGRGPVPVTGVEAVVLNITGDRADLDGFVTAWPAGTDRPVVSNLNLVAGGTRANLVIVPVSAGGKVSLFTSGGTHLIADVAGWFTDATAADISVGLFVPIMPIRVLDTRQEPIAPTAVASTITRRIGATSVVPPDSTIAVAANITATQTSAAGYVTVWPAHTPRPLVSNLNSTTAGQTIPNAAIIPLGQDELSLYSQGGAHLIIDIDGWYTNY